MDYAAALGLTLAVEVPVVVLVAGQLGSAPRRAAVVALVASLLTHPVLWFVVAPAMDAWLGIWGIVLAEIAVVVAEAVVYQRGLRPPIGWAASLWLSLLANALSFGIGVALW